MQQFKWTLREVLVEYTAAGCGTRPWDGIAYFTENITEVTGLPKLTVEVEACRHTKQRKAS
jgi:hypothetical protein